MKTYNFTIITEILIRHQRKIRNGIGIIIILFFIGLITFHQIIFRSLFTFLSVTQPVQSASVLVIEGWLFEYMIKEAADEFERGQYAYCIIISSKKDNQIPSNDIEKIIIERGNDKDKIRTVEIESDTPQFTYHSAIKVKEWLMVNYPDKKKLNVFTGGPHGRKSWIIYRRIFGENFDIGVISSSIQHFDVQNWWKSQHGFSVVSRYLIGYLYALLWPFSV